MKNIKIIFLLLTFACITASSCYRFQGISIDTNVKTFNVIRFKLNTSDAPATLNINFTEALNEKIRNTTSLAYSNTDADVEFTGAITSFYVTSEAPQPGEITAFNRLEIRVNVEYIDNQNEENSWKQTFSNFANYSASENLANVQDGLIDEIFTEIVNNVFDKAFTNW